MTAGSHNGARLATDLPLSARLSNLLRPRVAAPASIEYPQIDPLPSSLERPFWSVMIPTLNRTKYLEATLQSVLAQDPGPEQMQIEVVDNGSSRGNAKAIVREIGGGRVGFLRLPETIPAYANWNTCVGRARGRWVHLLHDDDYVLPGFYAHYQQLAARYENATLITGPCQVVDPEGKEIDVSEPMQPYEGPVRDFARREAFRNWVIPPSVAIRRDAYERWGGYCSFLRHTLDWELYFRLGVAGEVVTTSVPFSAYRVHSGSETDVLASTGQHVRDAMLTIDLCYSRLPASLQAELAANRYYSASELAKDMASRLLGYGRRRGAVRNALLAFRISPATSVRFLLGVMRRCALPSRRRPGRVVSEQDA